MPTTSGAHVPGCTYRVQLQAKFTFADLEALTPYFSALGITDFYLSPIFTATPGSLHGYDVTDYRQVSPELGGGAGFDRLADRLREVGAEILLDFVPNHMGIAGLLNRWWRDVLENGRHSSYAPFFDIQWKVEAGRGQPRVLVPVLDDHYGKVLEDGRLTLTYTSEFSLRYGDLDLPLSPSSYAWILAPLDGPGGDPSDRRIIAGLLAEFSTLPRPAVGIDPETARQRSEELERLKHKVAATLAERPAVRHQLGARLKELNGTPGVASSFDDLHALIERQHYRLARWQTGAHEINYRRFFAIDSLVGLHMEKTDVFRECHELLSRFVRDGKVAGLRIDHIDGLRQPEDYLRRLQSLERVNPVRPLYLVVEKILEHDESLPDSWPVHGTTGYEFISQLAGVLVAAAAAPRFDLIYRRFTGDGRSFPEQVWAAKRQVIRELFVNAVSNLGAELVEILAVDRRWRDLTRHELTTAVSELMASLPVYRTYRRRQAPVSAQDRQVLDVACTEALARNPRADPQPFEFVRDLLVGSYPDSAAPEDYRASLLSWVLTFQQYTGAIMAKAVEDTTFYNYNRLVALNEVGGDPECFGAPLEAFHRPNLLRLAHAPHTLLTTSTHDTKWSEDVRARLYALSELPDEWEHWLRDWRRLSARHQTEIDGALAPDDLDLYRFFQVLLGVWPLDATEADPSLRSRLRVHFRKAVSEAKRHTSILQTNEPYLSACEMFSDRITARESASDFLEAFLPCAQCIARMGMVNSLAQLILKCTVPGVPDFYQGNELWDFSLVDPDNRRDVDFSHRVEILATMAQTPVNALLETWRDGAIKLRVTQELLRLRSRHRALFERGDYQAVAAEGAFAEHLVAFTRQTADTVLLVVVPRLTAQLGSPPLGLAWDDTRLAPLSGQGSWSDVFSKRVFPTQEALHVRTLFAELPFGVLLRPASASPEPPPSP